MNACIILLPHQQSSQCSRHERKFIKAAHRKHTKCHAEYCTQGINKLKYSRETEWRRSMSYTQLHWLINDTRRDIASSERSALHHAVQLLLICSSKHNTFFTVLDESPLSFNKHLSYDDCLEVRGEIIRTVLCCIVYWKLCTVISTLRRAVLTVLWIGFCLTGLISLCRDSFVLMFVFILSCCICVVLL